MRLFLIAVFLSLSACVLAQEAKQGRTVNIESKSAADVALKKAEVLEKTAQAYTNAGNHAAALPLRRSALDILEGAFGRSHPNVADALINLALTHSALGQHDLTLPLQIRALAITEKVAGPKHEDTALALVMLGRTYQQLARYEDALPLQIRALAIAEKRYGAERLETSLAMVILAKTYFALDLYEKALPLQIRALGIAEKAFGTEHPNAVPALGDLANTYSALAQYNMALPLKLRALKIAEKSFGAEHVITAIQLHSLALFYSLLAQHEKAFLLQERVLRILEKIYGPQHPDTTSALNNLALTYLALGRVAIALPLQLRVLGNLEKSFGQAHPKTAIALGNLAQTYQRQGEYRKALPLQIRGLAIYEKTLGPDSVEMARELNNISISYLAFSKYDEAISAQRKSLVINERSFGGEHPATAESYAYFALSLGRVGQVSAAIEFLKYAVNIYQVQRKKIETFGQSELRSYTDSVVDIYRALALLLTEQGRLSEAQQVLDMLKEDEQFEFIRRSAIGDTRKSRIGYTGTEQIWMRRYREIADQLGKLGAEERELEKQAKLGLTPQQKQRQLAIAADLKVAQAAFESYLGEMREGVAQKGQARKVEVEEVSDQAMRESQSLIKGLGDDVALLQYYITDKRVGMLLTTPGVQLARSSNIDSKELNRKISELWRLLQDPKSNPVSAAQELYRILVAPVAQDLEQANAKTVMLSLDGALRYLPFGALHDGKQYLVDRWNLPMYTSVTRNKLRDTVSPQWQAAGLGVTKAWPEFKPLAGVQAEMGAIVKTAAGGFMPGEVYLDEAFTASRLKDVGQRKFSLMHVASHFRFSPGTEVNSFLLLGDGERLTLGDIRTQNYRFDNVELLTLSACDTGRGGGRDEQGKEIEGFGVIAQQQGAKAVLATLWRVVDESTATLMADLYRRRQSDSLTKIEALRQAQIAMRVRTKYAHPYYWAPFILMGNWK